MFFFFFNDTATTEIYTLSLHDALPISCLLRCGVTLSSYRAFSTLFTADSAQKCNRGASKRHTARLLAYSYPAQCESARSEEHTSELQSRQYLVCRLLLEKKKRQIIS